MKQMKLSVLIMSILAVLLVAGSIINSLQPEVKFYSSILFLAAVVLYLVIQIICVACFKFSLKKIGFYLCHVGIVILIISSFVTMIYLQDTSFSIPVDASASYGSVMREDGSDLEFGFEISVSDFQVKQYDPDYQLYRVDAASQSGYTLLQEKVMKDRKGIYHLNGYPNVPEEWLQDENGYLEAVALDEEYILLMLPQADRFYEADFHVVSDVGNQAFKLRMNEPCTYEGWKFYLMDYDHDAQSYISLYAKKDPGNLPFAVGLWMIIAGTAIMCFGLFEKKEA